MNLGFFLSCLLLLAFRIEGEVMKNPVFEDWVTIKDESTGVEAEFPHVPLEMDVDTPFQNSSLEGHIHLYSLPMQKGLLVLCNFQSFIHLENISKEGVKRFFEDILIPHFFFDPAVFLEEQTFDFDGNEKQASFIFSFKDHQEIKKLEGKIFKKDNLLYIPFYLSSEKDFDSKLLRRFLNSIHLSGPSTSRKLLSGG